MSKPKKGTVPVLDKLFNILRFINDSEIALSSYDVADITGYNQRTALRYLSRLVQERFIHVRVRMEVVTFDYKRQDSNKIFESTRPTKTYEYYNINKAGVLDE